MKRFITMLLVIAMVATMLPALAFSTVADEAKIEEGLNADWWQSVAELADGESGHWHAWRRLMGWGSEGYRASFDGNRLFDQYIDGMLAIAGKTGTKADVTEFAGGFDRDSYKAATGIDGDNDYLVKWTGTMKATTAGTYKFIGNKIDNGVVIFVDGAKAYEYWGTAHYFDGADENLISEQEFTITEAQVGKDIEFEMWFYEADGGEALAMTVTNDGTVAGKKAIAEAGFTFDLDVEYYTCLLKGDEQGDIEKHLVPGVKPDGTQLNPGEWANECRADMEGNNTFTEAQLTAIKGEMMKVGTSVVSDMDNAAYQDQQVCQQFGFHYDSYMVEYTGYLTPSYDGKYTFGTHAVDNCFLLQLEINGEWKNVYEFWANGIYNDKLSDYAGESYDLKAGTSYKLRAIFLEIGGGQPHQVIVKNEDTGVVYNNINSTMYLTTAPIAKADFTPKALSFTLDGDLSDWEGVHSLSTNDGSDGKDATFYAVVRDDGIYLACEAYHNVYKTDVNSDWWKNSNFEFFLRETGHVQYWVTAGQNGRANDRTSAFFMKNETLEGAATTYKTVTEVFVANCDLPNDTTIREGVARVGVAWKTEGDDKDNAHHGGVDNWWCPVYAANSAEKHFITEKGLYSDAEFTFDVDTAEELISYIKMVNAGTENHNNFTRNLTLNITADIDLTGYEWTPITRWVGTINGNGHTLSGIKFVTEGNGAHYGLLVGDIGNNNANGSVYDVIIKDSIIVAKNAGDDVGGIAGMVDRGRIDGCTVDNVTVIGSKWVGGIVGRACWGTEGDNVVVRDCTVKNSTIIGTATHAEARTASIVGTNDNATLDLGNYTVENVILKGVEGTTIGDIVGAWASDKQHIIGENATATGITIGTDNKTESELVGDAEVKWDADAPAALEIVTTGTDNSLLAVKVNGKNLKSSQYNVVEADGKLTITIAESYLATLKNGEYTVTVSSLEGDVQATVTVENSEAVDAPPTGDMTFVFVVAAILALGVAVVATKRRHTAK